MKKHNECAQSIGNAEHERAQEEWENSLSKIQHAAFEFWGKHSELIRDADTGAEHIDAEAKQAHAAMIEALERAPRVTGIFERGQALTPENLTRLGPRANFELEYLSAYTTDRNLTLEFACSNADRSLGREPAIFLAETCQAIDISALTGLNEREYIVLKGHKFGVIGREQKALAFMGERRLIWLIRTKDLA